VCHTHTVHVVLVFRSRRDIGDVSVSVHVFQNLTQRLRFNNSGLKIEITKIRRPTRKGTKTKGARSQDSWQSYGRRQQETKDRQGRRQVQVPGNLHATSTRVSNRLSLPECSASSTGRALLCRTRSRWAPLGVGAIQTSQCSRGQL
jgi:hypothetical protein